MTAQQKVTAGTPHVYQAIAAVMKDMASEGIGKTRKNQQQNYQFRGIDDVYNALAPILSRHQLCMLPRVLAREVVERQTKSGGALFYTTVDAEFDLVSAVDGSAHTIRTVGEAMDSADKSSNKAMSAAYKYAAMQAFCIPTEGDNDADETTHEVAPAAAAIDDHQFATLIQMIEATETDARAFCAHFKCASVKALPAGKYDAALKALQAKAAKKPEPTKQLAPAGDILDDEIPY